jgi:hypothetical protein
MKHTLIFVFIMAACALAVFGQVATPRESQRQEIAQTIGDTKISLIYHRPNVKGRKIWDGLVPFGKVWRAGANEATLFEFSRDVTINGQPLPAGKYSFHIIPQAAEWTLIFNKDEGQWGSFNYDAKDDALRVTAKVEKADFREALTYSFEAPKPDAVDMVIQWENLSVPFKINIGDIHGRVLGQIRDGLAAAEAEKKTPFLNQFANYVVTFKLTDHYAEAMEKIDASIADRETYSNLSAKARLLAAQGKLTEAVSTGEKAISLGRAATPPVNPNLVASLETLVTEWKTQM